MNAVGGIMIQGVTFFQAPTVAAANDGLSLSGTTVQLGDSAAAGTTNSQLLDNRAVFLQTFFCKWVGAFSGAALTNIFFNDQDGYLVVENDELNSVAPQSETGFKNRTLPSANPPFDQLWENQLGLKNTGVTFIRSNNLTGGSSGNIIAFESQTVPNGLTEMGRFLDNGPGAKCFMVNTTTQIGIITARQNSNATRIILAIGNTSAGANAQALAQWFNDVGNAFISLNSSGAATPNLVTVDNSTLAGDILIQSGTGNIRVVTGVGVTVNGGTASGGALDVNGAVNTSDPNTGIGKWKLGKVKAAGVALDATRYVEVNIDGTVVKLGVVV